MRMSTVSSARSPERTPQSPTWIENILQKKNEVSDEITGAKQTQQQQHTD